MSEDASAESPSGAASAVGVGDVERLAERLNSLFETVLRADGSEYSVSDVVRWVNATGGSTSRERLHAMRKATPPGRFSVDSPEVHKIAEFFCVPHGYFQEEEPCAIDGSTLASLIQQRHNGYRRGTIPQRVFYLFSTVTQADGRPYPATDVARWINANGGKITNVYIQKLISGERGERPQSSYLQWIGKFFGVGISFFYDDNPPEIDGQYQNAIIMLRNPKSAELQQLYGRLTPLQQEGVRRLMITLAKDNDPTFIAPSDPDDE
ncbi:hypothetical protein [Pseudonocardia alni]|uniref:hypothetical protein n=1 Tax=Pseudonocardia alni TaxID=33907 RepID=UPI00280B49FF|nr:hypothetical protein [Pseudonocardia alni]